jgi:murein DD-endopeptidase MepM/ murein hydrolase activator NlpD
VKTGIWHGVRRRLLPDREIIVRTGDRVAYLRLPRSVQVTALSAVVVALAWIALATHLNFNHLEIISSREARIAAIEHEHRETRRNLDEARQEIARVGEHVEAREGDIAELRATNRQLTGHIAGQNERIARGGVALAAATARHDAQAAETAALQRQIADLDAERTRLVATADSLRGELTRNGIEKQSLADKTAQLLPVIDELSADRALLTERADAQRDELARRVAERDRAIDERDRLIAERDAISDRFASLSSQLTALETAQEQIISRFDTQTLNSIELVEKTIAMTGVDVDRLLSRLVPDNEADQGNAGIGGPFIAAIDAAGGEAASELASNIAAVEQRVKRWRGLQTLLAQLPLTVPLDNYHVTSTFGRRVDPMTKRPAMHEGIDFSSERRAEVHATAPGKVRFVGWRGGYGKMVEIEHGLGIRTRFAHLSKIYVKRGQQVDFRDKIGQVGNTGRSTGEHLHYEVTVDGRALDPANFMKAGQYVFKE